MNAEASELRAQIDAMIRSHMRATGALQDVEWIEIMRSVNTAWGATVEYGVICPWCKEFYPNGKRDEAKHGRDCARQLALGVEP